MLQSVEFYNCHKHHIHSHPNTVHKDTIIIFNYVSMDLGGKRDDRLLHAYTCIYITLLSMYVYM